MNTVRRHPEKGSLILVVLCLLAVLGIALASFLAVSNQSMKLSNRSSRTGMSEQLAEMGLEEALRAYNSNNWSTWTANGTTATWTTSGTTASCTISFTSPVSRFGQNIKTATVSIRVDNYNATQLVSAWNSSTNYRIGNLVSYTDGIWYRCIANCLNKVPASSPLYWMAEQSSTTSATTWINGTSYSSGYMVTRNGAWYRCQLAHTASSSNEPPDGANWSTYWIAVPYLSLDSDLHYVNESIVNYYGTWYRYSGGNWYPYGSGWTFSLYWSSGNTYSLGNVVYSYSGGWYQYINTTPTSGNSLTNTTYWKTPLLLSSSAATAWNWSSTNTYNLNDVVYYSSSWYRSLAASNSNNTPSPSSAYWSVSPLLSRTWDSSRQYSQNDTVRYAGKSYLSLANNNYGQTPPTASPYYNSSWASTDDTTRQWNSSTSYSVGAYRSYGGVWYKCLSAGSNNSPNNSNYWTTSWKQSWQPNTTDAAGAPVVYAEGRVTLPDGPALIKTQLRATLAPAPLFPNAIAATSTLTINGGGTIDSYDSTQGPYGGSNIGSSAVLAATGTTSPAVTVTSTTVNGYVASPPASTSPYSPMWSYGGSAVLTGSGGSGIDLTRVSRSPSIPQFDIHSVAGGTSYPMASSTSYTIGTAGATTPTVYTIYSSSNSPSINMNAPNENLTIVGPVILNVQGNLHLSSSSKITIAETGSAEIHVSGRLRIDSDAGGIDNQTKDPKKCVLLCTSNSTTQNLSYAPSSQPFYGVIYMPNGTLTVDSGVYVYGALSAQNITFSSDANVHYDTSLRYAVIPGVDQPWSITQWRELTDPNDRAVLP